MPNKTALARASAMLQSRSYMPMEEAVVDLIAGGRDRAMVTEVIVGVAEVVPTETSATTTTGRAIPIPGKPLTDTRKCHVTIQVPKKMRLVETNNKNKKTNAKIIMPQTLNKKREKEPLTMKKFKLHITKIRSKKNLRRNTKMMVLKCPEMTSTETIKIEMIAETTGTTGIEVKASIMRIIKIIAIRTTKEMIKRVVIRITEIEVVDIKRTTMAQTQPQISDNTIKTTRNSTRLS